MTKLGGGVKVGHKPYLFDIKSRWIWGEGFFRRKFRKESPEGKSRKPSSSELRAGCRGGTGKRKEQGKGNRELRA